jgi:BA14K-like protein
VPAPRHTPQRIYVNAADAHEGWCAAKYRSYNPYDNTWIDKCGRLRICVSPY